MPNFVPLSYDVKITIKQWMVKSKQISKRHLYAGCMGKEPNGLMQWYSNVGEVLEMKSAFWIM